MDNTSSEPQLEPQAKPKRKKTPTPQRHAGGRPRGSFPPSDIVRRVREKLGLTRPQFARELGVTQLYLGRMEKYNRQPGYVRTAQQLERLAKRAKVPYTSPF